jgi:hypothetical protein
MDDFPKDFFSDHSSDPDNDNGEDATPVALVSTLEPLSIKVGEVEDESIPEGMVCMGSFLNDRLIARSAVPPEMITDIADRDVFASPVRIALAAVEQDPGLQCRLFALLPATAFAEETEPNEPWTQSVPKFEDTAKSQDLENAVVPLLLGHIVRFHRDRKHPEDLAAEAADVLRTILVKDQPMGTVVDKILEDLLDS